MIKDNKDLNDRRKLSYLLCEWDDKNLPHTIRYDNLTQQVINFFKTESKLVYPAKSYFVAIVYAKCLEKYFNIPFYEALDYNDLLFDDNFFVPYHKDKVTYDRILEKIGDIFQYQSINKTMEYFKKEFMFVENLPTIL